MPIARETGVPCRIAQLVAEGRAAPRALLGYARGLSLCAAAARERRGFPGRPQKLEPSLFGSLRNVVGDPRQPGSASILAMPASSRRCPISDSPATRIRAILFAIGEDDGAALPVVGPGSDPIAQGDLPSRRRRGIRREVGAAGACGQPPCHSRRWMDSISIICPHIRLETS